MKKLWSGSAWRPAQISTRFRWGALVLLAVLGLSLGSLILLQAIGLPGKITPAPGKEGPSRKGAVFDLRKGLDSYRDDLSWNFPNEAVT